MCKAVQYFSLDSVGYADYYSITKQGVIINTSTNEIVKPYRWNVRIVDINGNLQNVSVKSLYRKVFNKEFCIDLIQSYPEEEWKEIKDTGGKYFISTFGRCKSYCGYYARILKPAINSKGYYRVDINGKKVFIHRLVAEAFLINPNPEEYKVIHHKDNCKTNNNKINICYTTQSNNIKEYYNSIKQV